jgi:hypothetical protein
VTVRVPVAAAREKGQTHVSLLIPTSEIENGSLRVDEDGRIAYGDQRYAAVVLYHPEFERISTSAFFRKAAKGGTGLFRVGTWTHDFDGMPVDGERLLPKAMVVSGEAKGAARRVLEILRARKVLRQTPATGVLDNRYFGLRDLDRASYAPSSAGISRLIDGTVIQVAGEKTVSGDPIRSELEIDGHRVSVDAIGVAAVRLDEKGRTRAFAAGGPLVGLARKWILLRVPAPPEQR